MIPEDYRFCSKEEVDERQRTGEIHILEATIETADSRLPLSSRLIDRSRAVRKFVRSGSSDLQKRYLSRTPDQLHATTHYLICNIWHCTPPLRRNSGCSVSSTYAFVMDRLLAVRQEITSLSLSSSDPLFAVSLLKSMVHFYINSMHVLTSLSAENPNLSDADISTAGRMLLGSKEIRLPSLGSWFDLHLHESALSSCLKSALGLCCHIPLQQQRVFHINRDELSAYFMLLSAAQELRKCFHDVYFNKGNSSTNMKQTVRLSTMKELFSQRVALVPNNLVCLRMLHCLDSVLNFDPQDASHSDIANQSSAKRSLLAHIALKCVRCIRQGNSAGAVRAFSPIASYSLRKHDTSTFGGYVHKIRLRQRLMLGSLLHHMLPELRLLRLMQCDVAVTKNCEMDMSLLRNKLWLSHDDRSQLKPNKERDQIRAINEAADLLGMPVRTVVTPATSSAKITEATCVILKATLPAEPSIQGTSAAPLVRPYESDCDEYLRSRALLKSCRIAHANERELKSGMAKTNRIVEGYSRENSTDRMDSDSAEFRFESEEDTCFKPKTCISPANVIDALQEAIQDVHCEGWFDFSTQEYT